MIDFNTLENQLKTWIKTVTGLADDAVISQYDNHPRPTGQYATVRIFDPEVIGRDDKIYKTGIPINTVDITSSGLRKLMVSVNIYRNGTNTTLEQMSKLVSSFNSVTIHDYFQSIDLGVINSSPTRDLTSIVNDLWEERKQTDFFFYATDTDIENIESIEKISGTGFGRSYLVENN